MKEQYIVKNKPHKNIPKISLFIIKNACCIVSKGHCHVQLSVAKRKHTAEFFLAPDSESNNISFIYHCYRLYLYFKTERKYVYFINSNI